MEVSDKLWRCPADHRVTVKSLMLLVCLNILVHCFARKQQEQCVCVCELNIKLSDREKQINKTQLRYETDGTFHIMSSLFFNLYSLEVIAVVLSQKSCKKNAKCSVAVYRLSPSVNTELRVF